MNALRKFPLVLYLAAIASFSEAADSAAPLTWEDCVATAKKNNPALISAAKSVAASQADYKGSYNGLLPNLTLSSSYNNSDSPVAKNSRWNAAGQASLDLFNLKNNADIQSASAGLSESQAQLILQSSA